MCVGLGFLLLLMLHYGSEGIVLSCSNTRA